MLALGAGKVRSLLSRGGGAPGQGEQSALNSQAFYPDYGKGGGGYGGDEDGKGWEDGGQELGAEMFRPLSSEQSVEVDDPEHGMFIVSLPFTVMQGGWWGVVALVGVAAICYWTGVILVECLYDKTGARVRGTYRAVAEAVWGRAWGGRLVLGAQLIELLMTCILYVVLVGDMMENAFPKASMDKAGWMMLSATLLLPCVFLEDLGAVSNLSLANTISHVVINLIILLYCLACLPSWSPGSIRFSINIHTFPTVLGIVVFSYTSHIFLPALEGSLIDRRNTFRPMLKWSHIAAAVLKSVFGLLGFLAFADTTQEEISNSLPSQEFKALINLVLVFKALFSYPLPYYAVVEIIDKEFLRGPPHGKVGPCRGSDGMLKEWAIGIRVLVVLFTLFLALCIPHFAYLMGLVGNITGTMLSFVWPCWFHLQLRGQELSPRVVLLNKGIMGLGVLFGTIGFYYSASALYDALTAVDEYG